MEGCEKWKEWLEKWGIVRIKNALKVNTLRAYIEFLRRGWDENLLLISLMVNYLIAVVKRGYGLLFGGAGATFIRIKV